jgi:Pectate lyase superfamily protein/Major tropism determinant N-terminal domain
MAVYQISRIQIRRGQANQGTGLPQLASGEMAWAIDTQELYIGSGAVSEGAPAVSNIKVITQQDLGLEGSLLGLVQYVYGSSNSAIQTGITSNSPVGRPIALRLDDQVSTADFGTVGNNVADDTLALQRAINQLFLNQSQTSYAHSLTYPNGTPGAVATRITLSIPAGTYYTSAPIYIPSYSTIIGAGIDKTIINYNPPSASVTGATVANSPVLLTVNATSAMQGYIITGTGIPSNTTVTTVVPGVSLTLSNSATVSSASAVFTVTSPLPAIQFVNDNSTTPTPSTVIPDPSISGSTTQPRKIQFGNLTINVSTGVNTCMQLNSVKDSLFENINLTGGWVGLVNSNSIGINMTAVSSLVTCDHNIFRNIVASGFNYVVFASLDILNNLFEDCYISNSLQGFVLGQGGASTQANPYGPRQTEIVNCKFNIIYQQAVYVYTGSSNIVRDCKYVNVGNNGGSNTLAQYPQVYFATYGNASFNDQSDRQSQLSNPNIGTNATYALIPYVPEVSGHSVYTFGTTSTVTLLQTASFIQILKLPLPWQPTPSVLYNVSGATGPTGQIVYTVNYFYNSLANSFTRQGTLTITADVVNKQIQLSDEYNFAGSDPTDTNAIYLDFEAQFLDNTGAVTVSNPWTIIISYVNNLSSDTGVLTYNYTSIF